MAKFFFTNFGFNPEYELATERRKRFQEIEYGPSKSKSKIAFWTAIIYVALSLGIFLRRTVNFPDPLPGLNTLVFKWSIVAASFIIGLAVLAPLLRVISKFHKGQLSWQHCLTAFTIGFFGDMTFDFLISNFISVLKS
ncbi:MAG TPA: hypothetical protein VMR70_03420 [Flavisolibacter sp.]|nr:hypothetical protein [Flavisolibacter sp.]